MSKAKKTAKAKVEPREPLDAPKHFPANKRKTPCKHIWRTIQSFGALGYKARCELCREVGTFMAREE